MTPTGWLAGAAGTGFALLLWSSVSFKPGPRNLYEQQDSNRRWSYVIVAAFVLFVGFLGFGVDAYLLDVQGTDFPFATCLAVVASLFMAWFNFRNAAQMVLKASGARAPDLKDPKEAQFVNVVREMATAAGLPMPSTYVVPDPDLNAFATGVDPQHAHVAATAGLLQALDREELQGVVAHELSHIRNADMRVMTLVVALAGATALLTDWTARGMRSSSSSSGGGGSREGKKGGLPLFLLWLVFMVLAPIVTQLMAMAVSRRREFLADASGAELTRNPVSLARALEKIHKAGQPTEAMSAQGFGHLCIEDPRGSALNGWEGFFGDLLATHPPIEKRIAALREMAYLGRSAPDGNLV